MIEDQTFDAVSQAAHILGGIVAITIPYLLWHVDAIFPAVCILITGASIKEFWWDERYESPEVRGSSLRDFLFYLLGALIGIGIIGVSYVL